MRFTVHEPTTAGNGSSDFSEIVIDVCYTFVYILTHMDSQLVPAVDELLLSRDEHTCLL